MIPGCLTRFLSKIPREQLETGVAIVLRIPSLFIVELCFRTDPLKGVPVEAKATKDIHLVANFIYYAGKSVMSCFFFVNLLFSHLSLFKIGSFLNKILLFVSCYFQIQK